MRGTPRSVETKSSKLAELKDEKSTSKDTAVCGVNAVHLVFEGATGICRTLVATHQCHCSLHTYTSTLVESMLILPWTKYCVMG